jgi:amino acid transporter
VRRPGLPDRSTDRGVAVTTTPHGLARRSVGSAGLWVFGVSASAPMTVLAGGVVATYAGTGVVAVPLSFPILTMALLLFAAGYVDLARRAPHAAGFVAVLATGLGRIPAVAGAAVALLAYNAIQIALYGLLGATAAGLVGGQWWAWAGLAWFVVAVLGIGNVGLNARVVAAVLAAELAVIVVFDVVALTHPADPGAVWEPWRPELFAVDGVGGVLAFGIAAFVGFEAVTSFAEETRRPAALPCTIYTTLVFLGVLYAVSSWALAVAVGPDRIAETARDPASGIPFSILDTHLGPAAAAAGLALLGLSIVGASVSFHNVVCRYLYALGREGMLPGRLGVTGPGGVPTAGSAAQSTLALAAIAGFAVAGADPLAIMFTWLAALSAIAVMTLMVTASCAAIGAHRPIGSRRGSVVVAALGAGSMLTVLAVTVSNLEALTGDPTGRVPWLLTAMVALTAAAGTGWGWWLRRHRPAAYAVAGTGQPRPLAVRDGALRGLEL